MVDYEDCGGEFQGQQQVEVQEQVQYLEFLVQWVEQVVFVLDGFDLDWFVWIVFQFIVQFVDVDVDVVVQVVEIDVVDLVEDFVVGKYFFCLVGQQLEQFEFYCGQFDVEVFEFCFVLLLVDVQFVECQVFWGCGKGCVLVYQGVQVGEQYWWFDWFDYVVVGVGFQVEDVIEIVFLGGEYEDWQVCDLVDFLVYLQIILFGEYEVENYYLWFEVEEGGECGIIVMYLVYFEIMLGKEIGDQVGEFLVVFDE